MAVRRLNRIRDVIRERFPESRLEPLTDKQLAAVKRRHPKVPAQVLDFFKVVGCGSIGPSRYMIYDLIDAVEIFGEGSATELDGIVLIGDDFAGQHEAYDTKTKWRFGTVGGSGRFQPHTVYRDFLEFIERWFVEDDAG
jgi:hypothetical protein